MKVKYESAYNGQTSTVIYMINISDGETPRGFYIGSASNMRERRNQHIEMLIEGNHHNPGLQSDYDIYGEESIKFYILQTLDNKDHKIPMEDLAIKGYKPNYNAYPRALEDPNANPFEVTHRPTVTPDGLINFGGRIVRKRELKHYKLYKILKKKKKKKK